MSSNSNDYSEIDIKIEIQKTLVSVNELAHKIKNELEIINDLVKNDGQLHTAVIDANKTLTTLAKDMDIDVEDILENDEDELPVNIRDVLSSASFQQKLLKCLNNI